MIFQMLYIILVPLCPAFLKRVIFYKAPPSDKRSLLWLADWPTQCILIGRTPQAHRNVTPSHSSTSIVKFADDTVVLDLISNNDETAYLVEVERLTSWCQDNSLKLKSWLWTSGRDRSGPTLLLWSVGSLWRGWVASSTSV